MGRLNKQLGQLHVELVREPIEEVHRGVLDLSFESAEVGPIHAGVGGEPLLRDALLDPEAPQMLSNARSPLA